jgi:hypothetical protein
MSQSSERIQISGTWYEAKVLEPCLNVGGGGGLPDSAILAQAALSSKHPGDAPPKQNTDPHHPIANETQQDKTPTSTRRRWIFRADTARDYEHIADNTIAPRWRPRRPRGAGHRPGPPCLCSQNPSRRHHEMLCRPPGRCPTGHRLPPQHG